MADDGRPQLSRAGGKYARKSLFLKSQRMRCLNNNKKKKPLLVNMDHTYCNFSENPVHESTTVTDISSPIRSMTDIDSRDLDVAENIVLNSTDKYIPWYEGRRVVELKYLADQLFCDICNSSLRLSDIVKEMRYGLGSLLAINCCNSACQATKLVSTGKRNANGAFDINSKAALGMVHAGMGATHVNNFLTTCNIPPISPKTLRKKENEISLAIKKQADQSCSSARAEEREFSNNIECSFDAGWQTRGSGWQYNSNTGPGLPCIDALVDDTSHNVLSHDVYLICSIRKLCHASLVGIHTGKVLEYDVRSKICSVCQYHLARNETVPEHECNINWTGSSKAMEPDMASSILKKVETDNFPVKILHADNDSTTCARLKVEFKNLEKKDDKNHLKKNMSKHLYKISRKHAELKVPGVIPYLVRCFMYTITSNKDSEENMKAELGNIISHVFGDHTTCVSSQWCKYSKDPINFKFKHLPNGKPLTDEGLKKELNDLAESYKKRANHLKSLGSTQANENFNNIVASKAPKNRSYGGTKSLETRVSAAVIQKNDGYIWVNERREREDGWTEERRHMSDLVVNKRACLSPGKITKKHARKMDRRRLWLKAYKAQNSYKRRRLILKMKRKKAEKKESVKEGTTYNDNVELVELVEPTIDEIETIPSKTKISGCETYVVFDLETTGLSRGSDITQLSAFDGNESLNIYVSPNQHITPSASNITGITYSFTKSQMFHHGKEVASIDIRLALVRFIEYIKSRDKIVLVGHNIMCYDIPILYCKLKECNLLREFLCTVSGCLDTLKLAKKDYKKQDVGNFKQQTLVNKLLGRSYDAHNALEDVKSLYDLFVNKLSHNVKDLFPFNMCSLVQSFDGLVNKKHLTKAVARRLAHAGLGLGHLKLAFNRDGQHGVKSILSEHGFLNRTANSFVKFFEAKEE